jgi:hypothetical protein
MSAHKGPANSRPRYTRGGSSVAAIPFYRPTLRDIPEVRVINQVDALFISSLFSHHTSTCFGLASCPSSGGNNIHIHIYIYRYIYIDR